MLLFNSDYNRHPFQEVLINGREPEQDENERPTDYTAEDDDTQDTGNPPTATEPPEDNTNPVDNPVDYTVPDDDGDTPPGGGGAANDNTPNTGEGMGAPTTDYTADTGATPQTTAMNTPTDTDAPDAGADPAPPATDAGANAGGDEGGDEGGMEGDGEGTPTDYTTGGGDEGGQEGDLNAGGGDMGGGDEGESDMGGSDESGGDEGYSDYDDSDSSGDGSGYDQQIQDLEKDIYADLNEPQMDIRNRELKQNFINLYNMIGDISERINDISKDTASIKPLEFVASRFNTLSDTISDYLTNTFSTKSYTENDINYRLFLKTVEDINSILAHIKGDS